jgi:peptidoglycan/LPS O-acetylase OafA/YrhL
MAANFKITTLGLLRGFAVLAVCFRHLAKPLLVPDHFTIFNLFHKFGLYGVQVFFVISGFIIPYSLYKADYKISHYFQFLWKRVLRLHPPYIIALILTFAIAFISYKMRHLPNPESVSTFTQSLFYLHAPADNPVFWTLRIEAEYYLFIGLFFIPLKRYPIAALLAGIPVLLLLGHTQLVYHVGLIRYIVFFLIGIVGFMIYTRQGNLNIQWFLLVLLVAYSFVYHESAAATFSLITISFILFFKKPVHSVLEFPGEISYSLYLIHFPIGTKVINLLSRVTDPSYKWALFVLALAICVAAGWLFWKLIEKPSARLSTKVKYGNRKMAFANFDVKD